MKRELTSLQKRIQNDSQLSVVFSSPTLAQKGLFTIIFSARKICMNAKKKNIIMDIKKMKNIFYCRWIYNLQLKA